MRPGTTFAGATLLIACMALLPGFRAGAQETVLKTEPLPGLEVNQNDGTVVAGLGAPRLTFRVSPNINNDNLRDAIKKVIGKADVTYEIDSDVPNDIKVSLKAENILLTTAINALTESAGIGCTQTTTHLDYETNGKHSVGTPIHLHFRKALAPPLGQGSSSWLLNIPTNVFDKGAWSNKDFKLTQPFIKSGDGKIPFSSTLITPNGVTDYTNKLLDNLNVYTSPNKGAQPFLYHLTSSEERSTFTCPHCKQQVTIIKKHVAPKCPTCGRTLQDDWKFCPVDGTKRPEDSGEWKFCPHCGKAVS